MIICKVFEDALKIFFLHYKVSYEISLTVCKTQKLFQAKVTLKAGLVESS